MFHVNPVPSTVTVKVTMDMVNVKVLKALCFIQLVSDSPGFTYQ